MQNSKSVAFVRGYCIDFIPNACIFKCDMLTRSMNVFTLQSLKGLHLKERRAPR